MKNVEKIKLMSTRDLAKLMVYQDSIGVYCSTHPQISGFWANEESAVDAVEYFLNKESQ